MDNIGHEQQRNTESIAGQMFPLYGHHLLGASNTKYRAYCTFCVILNAQLLHRTRNL
ncbi:hypothetical protein D3C75_668440 [compost metagenome]